MQCINCGYTLNDNEKICPKCNKEQPDSDIEKVAKNIFTSEATILGGSILGGTLSRKNINIDSLSSNNVIKSTGDNSSNNDGIDLSESNNTETSNNDKYLNTDKNESENTLSSDSLEINNNEVTSSSKVDGFLDVNDNPKETNDYGDDSIDINEDNNYEDGTINLFVDEPNETQEENNNDNLTASSNLTDNSGAENANISSTSNNSNNINLNNNQDNKTAFEYPDYNSNELKTTSDMISDYIGENKDTSELLDKLNLTEDILREEYGLSDEEIENFKNMLLSMSNYTSKEGSDNGINELLSLANTFNYTEDMFDLSEFTIVKRCLKCGSTLVDPSALICPVCSADMTKEKNVETKYVGPDGFVYDSLREILQEHPELFIATEELSSLMGGFEGFDEDEDKPSEKNYGGINIDYDYLAKAIVLVRGAMTYDIDKNGWGYIKSTLEGIEYPEAVVSTSIYKPNSALIGEWNTIKQSIDTVFGEDGSDGDSFLMNLCHELEGLSSKLLDTNSEYAYVYNLTAESYLSVFGMDAGMHAWDMYDKSVDFEKKYVEKRNEAFKSMETEEKDAYLEEENKNDSTRGIFRNQAVFDYGMYLVNSDYISDEDRQYIENMDEESKEKYRKLYCNIQDGINTAIHYGKRVEDLQPTEYALYIFNNYQFYRQQYETAVSNYEAALEDLQTANESGDAASIAKAQERVDHAKTWMDNYHLSYIDYEYSSMSYIPLDERGDNWRERFANIHNTEAEIQIPRYEAARDLYRAKAAEAQTQKDEATNELGEAYVARSNDEILIECFDEDSPNHYNVYISYTKDPEKPGGVYVIYDSMRGELSLEELIRDRDYQQGIINNCTYAIQSLDADIDRYNDLAAKNDSLYRNTFIENYYIQRQYNPNYDDNVINSDFTIDTENIVGAMGTSANIRYLNIWDSEGHLMYNLTQEQKALFIVVYNRRQEEKGLPTISLDKIPDKTVAEYVEQYSELDNFDFLEEFDSSTCAEFVSFMYGFYGENSGDLNFYFWNDWGAMSLGQRRAEERASKLSDNPSIWDCLKLDWDSFCDGLKTWAEGYDNLFNADGRMNARDYEQQYYAGMLADYDAEHGTHMVDRYNIASSIGNMFPSMVAATLFTVCTMGVGGGAAAATLGTKIAMTVARFAITYATMGLSVAGNAKERGMQLGMSKEDALKYGLLSGLSETALESILGEIPGIRLISKWANVGGIVGYLGKMLSEGIEEGLQEVIDTYMLAWFLGEDLSTVKIDWEQVIKAGIYGAITAGILNGGSIVIEGASYVLTGNASTISFLISKYATSDLTNSEVRASLKSDLKLLNIMETRISDIVESLQSDPAMLAQYEAYQDSVRAQNAELTDSKLLQKFFGEHEMSYEDFLVQRALDAKFSSTDLRARLSTDPKVKEAYNEYKSQTFEEGTLPLTFEGYVANLAIEQYVENQRMIFNTGTDGLKIINERGNLIEEQRALLQERMDLYERLGLDEQGNPKSDVEINLDADVRLELEAKLSENGAKMSALESKINDLGIQLHDKLLLANQELSKLRTIAEPTEEQIERMQKLNDQIKMYSMYAADIIAGHESIKQSLIASQTYLVEYESNVKDLESKIKATEEQIAKLKADNNTSNESKIKELEAETKNLKEKLEATRIKVRELRSAVDSISSRNIKTLTSENEALTKEIEFRQKDLEKLQKQLEVKRAQLKNQKNKNKIKKLESEITKLESQIKQINKTIIKLNSKIVDNNKAIHYNEHIYEYINTSSIARASIKELFEISSRENSTINDSRISQLVDIVVHAIEDTHITLDPLGINADNVNALVKAMTKVQQKQLIDSMYERLVSGETISNSTYNAIFNSNLFSAESTFAKEYLHDFLVELSNGDTVLADKVSSIYEAARKSTTDQKLSNLYSYCDHTEAHTLQVAFLAVRALNAINAESLNTTEYGQVTETDFKEMFVAGLMHDLGMAAGTVVDGHPLMNGTNIVMEYLESLGDARIKAIKIDFNAEDLADIVRSNHTLNSATAILALRTELEAVGLNPDRLAMLCFSHSKSNSGVGLLTSANDWALCVAKIQAAVDVYNSQLLPGQAKIHFDLSTIGVQSPIMDAKTDSKQKTTGEKVEASIKSVKFLDGFISEMATKAFALRVGDAFVNKAKIKLDTPISWEYNGVKYTANEAILTQTGKYMLYDKSKSRHNLLEEGLNSDGTETYDRAAFAYFTLNSEGKLVPCKVVDGVLVESECELVDGVFKITDETSFMSLMGAVKTKITLPDGSKIETKITEKSFFEHEIKNDTETIKNYYKSEYNEQDMIKTFSIKYFSVTTKINKSTSKTEYFKMNEDGSKTTLTETEFLSEVGKPIRKSTGQFLAGESNVYYNFFNGEIVDLTNGIIKSGLISEMIIGDASSFPYNAISKGLDERFGELFGAVGISRIVDIKFENFSDFSENFDIVEKNGKHIIVPKTDLGRLYKSGILKMISKYEGIEVYVNGYKFVVNTNEKSISTITNPELIKTLSKIKVEEARTLIDQITARLDAMTSTELIDAIKTICESNNEVGLAILNNTSSKYMETLTRTMIEPALSYYESAAKYAETASAFETYRTHTEGHVREVAESSMRVLEVLSRTLNNNKYSNKVNAYDLFVAAIWHDVGMGAGAENILGIDSHFDVDTGIYSPSLLVDSEGNRTRSNHTLNSALAMLANADIISDLGVNVSEVALLVFAHSKSNSGMKNLTSTDSYQLGINIMQACIEEYNSQARKANEQITDSSKKYKLIEFGEGKTYIDSLVDSKLIESYEVTTDSDGKTIYKIKFNDSRLKIIATEALALRVGDANTTNENLNINQAGQLIEYIVSSEMPDVDYETKYKEMLKKNPGLSFKDFYRKMVIEEAQGIIIKLGGEVLTDPNSYSLAYILGEDNLVFEISPDTGEYDVCEVCRVKDGNFQPAATIFNILERLGEIVSGASRNNFGVLKIVLPENTSDVIFEKYLKAAMRFNSGEVKVTVIREGTLTNMTKLGLITELNTMTEEKLLAVKAEAIEIFKTMKAAELEEFIKITKDNPVFKKVFGEDLTKIFDDAELVRTYHNLINKGIKESTIAQIVKKYGNIRENLVEEVAKNMETTEETPVAPPVQQIEETTEVARPHMVYGMNETIEKFNDILSRHGALTEGAIIEISELSEIEKIIIGQKILSMYSQESTGIELQNLSYEALVKLFDIIDINEFSGEVLNKVFSKLEQGEIVSLATRITDNQKLEEALNYIFLSADDRLIIDIIRSDSSDIEVRGKNVPLESVLEYALGYSKALKHTDSINGLNEFETILAVNKLLERIYKNGLTIQNISEEQLINKGILPLFDYEIEGHRVSDILINDKTRNIKNRLEALQYLSTFSEEEAKGYIRALKKIIRQAKNYGIVLPNHRVMYNVARTLRDSYDNSILTDTAKRLYFGNNRGVNQGIIKGIMKYGQAERKAQLIKQVQSKYPGISAKQASKFLSTIDTNVGVCNYADFANAIAEYFVKHPEISFEERFGFPLFIQIDGIEILNAPQLLLDIYMEINGDIFVKSGGSLYEFFTGSAFKSSDSNRGYLNLNKAVGENYKYRLNLLNKYLNSRGFNIGTNEWLIQNTIFNSYGVKNLNNTLARDYVVSMISRELAKGRHLSIGTVKGAEMINQDGSKIVVRGAHVMTILGVMEDGKILVNSWGSVYEIEIGQLLKDNIVFTIDEIHIE